MKPAAPKADICTHGALAPEHCRFCTPPPPGGERWTIRVCETHRALDCALCGVFDVIEVAEVKNCRVVHSAGCNGECEEHPEQRGGRSAGATPDGGEKEK